MEINNNRLSSNKNFVKKIAERFETNIENNNTTINKKSNWKNTRNFVRLSNPLDSNSSNFSIIKSKYIYLILLI